MTEPTADDPAHLTTVGRVARVLSLAGDQLDAHATELAEVVSAVTATVTWLTPDDAGHYAPGHRHGATLLAARLFRRRNSVSGVLEQFASEGGAVYVQRTDPDVAMLLGLGSWATPAVG